MGTGPYGRKAIRAICRVLVLLGNDDHATTLKILKIEDFSLSILNAVLNREE
jgi:hypothetical protein